MRRRYDRRLASLGRLSEAPLRRAGRRATLKLRRWVTPITAVIGGIAAIGGAVALFKIDNSAGSLFLLTLGIVLLAIAFVGDRVEIESFELLGARVKVRDVVRIQLELARQTGGDDERTASIREQAFTLQKLAGLYEYIRRTRTASNERTGSLDRLAIRIQQAAKGVRFEPAEVAAWFHQGSDALRVIALNLMIAQEAYRDFSAIVRALEDRRSLFEQYYALQLGKEMLSQLDRLERELLEDAIMRARQQRRFRHDAPLMARSDEILDLLRRRGGRVAAAKTVS
jgi:hypothetical protein